MVIITIGSGSMEVVEVGEGEKTKYPIEVKMVNTIPKDLMLIME